MAKKLISLVIILLVGVLTVKFFFLPLKLRLVGEKPFMVRVRLVHDSKNFTLGTVGGGCSIVDIKNGRLLDKNIVLDGKDEVLAGDPGIKVREKEYNTEGIRVIPRKGAGFVLNDVNYRGSLDIRRKGTSLNAINSVKLEDYLKGVLPREVSRFWPFEAIKAQAIASRSFAVNAALNRKDRYYDLRADTFAQVYGGASSERWRTTKAVRATQGKVLAYDGKVIPAYFHSSCGGRTESALDAWMVHHPSLKGVKCSWCRWSPTFRWRTKINTRDILDRLKERGHPVEEIDRMIAGSRDDSGRLRFVKIRSKDKWVEVTDDELRSALGRKTLRSDNFHIKRYPRFYLFSGYGWGHGVGMCQWGAFGLALRWKKADQILGYYYAGAEIVSLKDILERNEIK